MWELPIKALMPRLKEAYCNIPKRVEWAKYNIRVNAVSPGYIETDLTAKNFKNPTFRTAVFGKTPMDRFGEAAEVVDAVCFLSSDAASYITGACIPVDGGFIAGHPGIVMQ